MTRYEIKKWMLINVDRFIDRRTREVNTTKMTETWNIECNGTEMISEDHIAWEVAVDVQEKVDSRRY